MSWTRTEAREKVTGRARFAADHPADRHAVLVTSAIPVGGIRGFILGACGEAEHDDVVVFTHQNAPRLSPPAEGELAEGRVSVYAQRILPLQDDRVHYEGQPVAVVVAGTPQRAQAVAGALQVEYAPEPARTSVDPDSVRTARDWLVTSTSRVGDVQAGIAEADVLVEEEYRTSPRHHHPIEPSATVAEWRDDRLLLYDATQSLFAVRDTVAEALGLPAESVRVVAENTGGGFGSKGYVWPHVLIAAMVARTLGGRVKLTLSRAQAFTSNGHQPETRQRVTLAARSDGRLLAVRHVSTNTTARYAEYAEYSTVGTRSMYASPAIETETRVAPVDLPLPTPMRSPHEGTGMFALESAMDELADRLGIDPLDLRLRNDAHVEPTTGRAFSSKKLRECYLEGARRIGWERRAARPRSVRSGNAFVGLGMASVILHVVRLPATARVAMAADGSVTVSAGTQEIGGGTRTIMPKLAAEVLGVDPDRVVFRMGDTDLPQNLYSVGSSTAISLGSAVQAAARELKERLATAPPPLTVETTWFPEASDRAMHSFGAVFAEVHVDADLPIPRVRRLVGVYSAGRILNPLTARGQLTGGLVWGIGQALLERSAVDESLGRYVSKNLSGSLVPVNADVPELEVSFVDEYDPHASGVGGRGIGELAPIGVAAAIANAVHNATGVRLRSLPLTVEGLLKGA